VQVGTTPADVWEADMNLYYADGDRQVGPIGKTELQALIRSKKVNANTLVRQNGMENWQKLGIFVRRMARGVQSPEPPSVPVPPLVCSECGRSFPEDEMIRFQDSRVCGACKPLFFQKIKEGVSVAGAMDYAGFWIRCGALVIDTFILGMINMLIFIPMGILMPFSFNNPTILMSFFPLLMLLQYAIPAAYDTWFVGKYQATPGKMACKLKIVVADGSRVSYLRSLARHFAKWISAMILLIGYIMAAFDDQKQSLHDRICETRVIRK